MTDFKELGKQAFRDGKGNFPLADPTVYQAVKDLPVGAGAKRIMKAFSKGWHEENVKAEAL